MSRLRFTHRAAFSYTAPAPTSVYETGHVETGDPVFLRTTSSVAVTATYDFVAKELQALSGRIGLRADVRDGSGWHRSIELAAPSPFTGTHAMRTAQLDLGSLQQRLADMRAATGTNGGSYIVDISADIAVTGRIGGRPLEGAFTPHIEFQLDAVRLSPVTGDSTSKTPFSTSATKDLTTTRRVPNRVDLRWFRIPISPLRAAGVAGAVVAGLAASIAAAGLRRRLPDESAKIALRFGHRLVRAHAVEPRDGERVVDLTSIGDLVRLADQHEMLILHERAPASDTYHFQTDRTVYRYVSCHDVAVHAHRPSA